MEELATGGKMKTDYILLDPTGNVTILVRTSVPAGLQPAVAARLMALEPAAEQVGFISREEGYDMALRMAGGEFCGNASMSAAAVAAMEEGRAEGRMKLRVSGAFSPVMAEVKEGSGGIWHGTVDMPRPAAVEEADLPGAGRQPVVVFDGISHIILKEKMPREKAEEMAVAWCSCLGADAVGLMFLDEEEAALTPLVYVPAAGTLFWENSCASGTSAVGVYLAARAKEPVRLTLRQPGGSLTVEAHPEGTVRLTGTVRLIRRGSAEVDPD